MIKKKFELLAPAGSFEIFKAVIEAGADAVYVGGAMFGARAYANNFTEEELLYAIDYAHLRGRKVYLTVNTLLKDMELKDDLYDYLLPYYNQGIDALIVQDIGAIAYIRECFPDLPIHTSTQMTITSQLAVEQLKQYDVERVVLAREMSIDEMKAFHEETGMEIEVFVHGALCYCYSGQCLLSSVIGGRSGNRGRCAQPCRLPYTVLDQEHKKIKENTYILSMKDMCGMPNLEELDKAGVYSLKIEGRMKQLSYAAGVVSYYRQVIDQYEKTGIFKVDESVMEGLYQTGNRCGFTNGYYVKHNGKDMITYEKPNFEKASETFSVEIEKKYTTFSKIGLKGIFQLYEGTPANFELSYQNHIVYVEGMEGMEAQKTPVNEEDLRERLNKTGDYQFYFEDLEIYLGDNVFLPNGAINKIRRDAIEKMQEVLLAGYRRTNNKAIEIENQSFKKDYSMKDSYAASIEDRALLPILIDKEYINEIYLDSSIYGFEFSEMKDDVKKIHGAHKKAYYIFPAIFRDEIANRYESHKEELNIFDGFVAKTLEEITFIQNNYDIPFVIDHNLYAFNDYAKNQYEKTGALRTTIPLELNRKEIINKDNTNTEFVIYGRYPLMISAQCVHKNSCACDKKMTTMYLHDRKNAMFPVKNYCSFCYNIIYNSLPTILWNDQKQLSNIGIHSFRFMFTTETPGEVKEVFAAFENHSMELTHTNGHYKRGVE